jgi:hypothetical protein
MRCAALEAEVGARITDLWPTADNLVRKRVSTVRSPQWRVL